MWRHAYESIELNVYYNVNFDYLSKLKEIYKYRLEPYEVKCEIKFSHFTKCEIIVSHFDAHFLSIINYMLNTNILIIIGTGGSTMVQ